MHQTEPAAKPDPGCRKFGFTVEGTFKAYALRDGGYVDALAMARVIAAAAP